MHIFSISSHINTARYIWLSLFYNWENWDSEQLRKCTHGHVAGKGCTESRPHSSGLESILCCFHTTLPHMLCWPWESKGFQGDGRDQRSQMQLLPGPFILDRILLAAILVRVHDMMPRPEPRLAGGIWPAHRRAGPSTSFFTLDF